VDLRSEECKETFTSYFDSIQVSEEEAVKIEHLTKGQYKQESWKKARSERITSSNFGRIFVRKPQTAPDNLVRSLMRYDKEFHLCIQDGESHMSQLQENSISRR